MAPEQDLKYSYGYSIQDSIIASVLTAELSAIHSCPSQLTERFPGLILLSASLILIHIQTI